MPRCSSFSVVILISSALMESGICLCLTLLCSGNAHAQFFFISVCLIVILDSQSVVNSCGPGLYSICMLY